MFSREVNLIALTTDEVMDGCKIAVMHKENEEKGKRKTCVPPNLNLHSETLHTFNYEK